MEVTRKIHKAKKHNMFNNGQNPNDIVSPLKNLLGPDSFLSRFVSKLAWKSAPAVGFVFFTELVVLWATPASRFLFKTSHWIAFLAQGLALLVLTSVGLTAVVIMGEWGSAVFRKTALKKRMRFLRTIKTPLALQGIFLLLLGTLLVSNGHRSVVGLAPFHHYLLVPVFSAGVMFPTFFWARRDKSQQKVTTILFLTVLSIIFSLWVVGHYLPKLFAGEFGLHSKKTIIRTCVALGVPALTFLSLPAVCFSKSEPKGLKKTVALCLFALGTVTAYLMNSFYHVDRYLELHAWLHLMTFTFAYCTAELVGFNYKLSPSKSAPASQPPQLSPTSQPPQSAPTSQPPPPVKAASGFVRKEIHRIVICLTLIIASGVILATMGMKSVAGYVGAIHTTFQRFGLEMLHGKFPNLHRAPVDLYRYSINRLHRFRSEHLPVKDGPLPGGFHFLSPTQDISRPTLNGAVVFFLDRKRPHDLGPYTKTASPTPNIDKCFADAFIFTGCRSAGSSTDIAFPSIYTSSYAASRGQGLHTLTHRPPWFKSGEPKNLLATFAEAGFHTTVVTNHWYASSFFLHPLKKALFGGFDRLLVGKSKGGDKVLSLQDIVAEHPDIIPSKGRFLTVFHLLPQSSVHLNEIDRFVGNICELLKKRGRFKDTAILLTADHGVQYREHGRTSYGMTLFEEEIRVPLLVRVPSLQGRIISDLVSSVDHLPFLADLFSLPLGFQIEGTSYLKALFGKPLERERVIYAETRRTFYSVAAISGDMKLIRWAKTGATSLFDLSRDPKEIRNLIENPDYQARLKRLEKKLRLFLRQREEF